MAQDSWHLVGLGKADSVSFSPWFPAHWFELGFQDCPLLDPEMTPAAPDPKDRTGLSYDLRTVFSEGE